MSNDGWSDKSEKYCSTTEAARLLGVSVGTVQQMVESGKLIAWKTNGGHRRILLRSIQQQREPVSTAVLPIKSDPDGRLQVVIVEDDDFMRTLYKRELENMALPLTLELFDNGLEAMLRLGAGFPHLLILDLELPYIDGFEMLKHIKTHKENDFRHIIVVSGLDDSTLKQHETVLGDVTVLKKPLDSAVLKGYLLALKHIYL